MSEPRPVKITFKLTFRQARWLERLMHEAGDPSRNEACRRLIAEILADVEAEHTMERA
jgi:hypothetical protein